LSRARFQQQQAEDPMTIILIAASLLCLLVPAAVITALFYNDHDARRAEYGRQQEATEPLR
jgi:hypothetical protein